MEAFLDVKLILGLIYGRRVVTLVHIAKAPDFDSLSLALSEIKEEAKVNLAPIHLVNLRDQN